MALFSLPEMRIPRNFGGFLLLLLVCLLAPIVIFLLVTGDVTDRTLVTVVQIVLVFAALVLTIRRII